MSYDEVMETREKIKQIKPIFLDGFYKTFTKVRIAPMNNSTYCAYRGWVIPSYEDNSDEGYLIEYSSKSKSNHRNHKGRISWINKTTFMNDYIDVKAIEDIELQNSQDVSLAHQIIDNV